MLSSSYVCISGRAVEIQVLPTERIVWWWEKQNQVFVPKSGLQIDRSEGNSLLIDTGCCMSWQMLFSEQWSSRWKRWNGFRWLEHRFCCSFRSWSSQISLLCSIAFTLSLLPKWRVWTRCLWRAKALRLQLGFLPFPLSHVIPRHLNSNTPLDRHCTPQTSPKRMLHLAGTVG